MKASAMQLLVHLDPSPRAAQRLEVAQRLGPRLEAAITALYAVTPSFMELPFSPGVGPGMGVALREIDDEQRARARALFEQAQAASDAHISWAEVRDEPIMAAFAQQALYADLLVLGQHDPTDAGSTHVPADFAETVLAISGKPALILPYAIVPPAIGETVVIAWKPTREAARAVAAALPFLQSAQRVHVVSWEDEDADIGGEGLGLSGYLKLKGVEAIWHHQGKERERLGEQLLSRAFDFQADLLVMGCYGHSRAREWVLGGTSRTVLESMTLPVLMVH
ncbi:universal stress protein [Rhodoferax sediminis]|nr:universal stress protein [Rhodoferax sediminis]